MEKLGYPSRFSTEFENSRIGCLERAHYTALEKIKAMYSVLYNANIFQGENAEQLIRLCWEDIGRAAELRAFWVSEGAIPNYDTFKQLSILYEKRKEYDQAIEVCKQAIQLGFIHDGTDGQMVGRLARLMKLAGRTEELQELVNKGQGGQNHTVDSKWCPKCGSQLPSCAVTCSYCGASQQVAQSKIQNVQVVSPKNKWVAFGICLVLGIFGFHRFYVGKIGSGVLYFFTDGLFCVGWIVDLFRILSGNFTEKANLFLK